MLSLIFTPKALLFLWRPVILIFSCPSSGLKHAPLGIQTQHSGIHTHSVQCCAFRLLCEVDDAAGVVDLHDAEGLGPLPVHGQRCHCDCGPRVAVCLHEGIVVHAVQVVTWRRGGKEWGGSVSRIMPILTGLLGGRDGRLHVLVIVSIVEWSFDSLHNEDTPFRCCQTSCFVNTAFPHLQVEFTGNGCNITTLLSGGMRAPPVLSAKRSPQSNPASDSLLEDYLMFISPHRPPSCQPPPIPYVRDSRKGIHHT